MRGKCFTSGYWVYVAPDKPRRHNALERLPLTLPPKLVDPVMG